MKQHFSILGVATHGTALYPITGNVAAVVTEAAISDGLLTCLVRHTSASLLIQENADPDVLWDLTAFLDRLVPRDVKLYRHGTEGPDDMPSHIRCMLTQTSLSIPIQSRKMMLGRWQGIYLFEHRDQSHRREVVVHVIGTT